MEEHNSIVAVLGVGLSEKYQNGYLMVGYEEQAVKYLEVLFEYLEQYLKQQQIKRLNLYTLMIPGRIRNHQISFWERYGFLSDMYFHALMRLEMKDWQEPENIETNDMEVIHALEKQEIINLLLEDEEEHMADLFEQECEYIEQVEQHKHGKNFVFLKLRHPSTGEVLGISYYRVIPFALREGEKPTVTAMGLLIHFRPSMKLDRKEKNRMIQATLLTMREIGVGYVVANKSSKDFDSFIEMLAVGFDVAPEYSIRLVKQVE